jgi:DNA-binding response OmpR family regulator
MTPTARAIEDTIRVLFIEDDPAVSEMYKLKLELDGYQVTVVANDGQVLAAAARIRPDMIFIDLRVGDDERFATLGRLRATAGTRELPVIILSNQGPGELAGRGFNAHQLDYVVRADPGPTRLASNLEAWARAGSG